MSSPGNWTYLAKLVLLITYTLKKVVIELVFNVPLNVVARGLVVPAAVVVLLSVVPLSPVVVSMPVVVIELVKPAPVDVHLALICALELGPE